MAALPNTGISISMVRNAIGASTNDLGALFLHPNVNEWGFNCTKMQEQEAVWGQPDFVRAKLSPSAPGYVNNPFLTPGYNLGYFRNYDHDWMVYTLGTVDFIAPSYEDVMKFRINIIPAFPKLEGKPQPNPKIFHDFEIKMSRSLADAQANTGTVFSGASFAGDPYTEIEFSTTNPPDYLVNGVLEPLQKFWLRFNHLSSPERRWIEPDTISTIFEFTTPQTAFSNIWEYRNFSITAIKKTTAPALTVFTVEADLYADLSSQHIIDFTGTMSNTVGYTSNVYNLTQTGVIISTNPTPGTASFVKQLSFDFSATNLKNFVSVGNTVYGKIVASTGQTFTGSAVVTNNPIEE